MPIPTASSDAVTALPYPRPCAEAMDPIKEMDGASTIDMAAAVDDTVVTTATTGLIVDGETVKRVATTTRLNASNMGPAIISTRRALGVSAMLPLKPDNTTCTMTAGTMVQPIADADSPCSFKFSEAAQVIALCEANMQESTAPTITASAPAALYTPQHLDNKLVSAFAELELSSGSSAASLVASSGGPAVAREGTCQSTDIRMNSASPIGANASAWVCCHPDFTARP
mmetsp:Transcript_36024/g.99317  ORF Transcript_36024/g.99317 Transcript_36024/m.99317 type:complete len:228 (-) Transcript_36024:492-1175(-)